jgi:hypothetical protein
MIGVEHHWVQPLGVPRFDPIRVDPTRVLQTRFEKKMLVFKTIIKNAVHTSSHPSNMDAGKNCHSAKIY